VEPAAGDGTRPDRSASRTLQRVENPQTIADGARTQSMGRLTFPLVLAKRPRLPHRHRREELVDAMRFCGSA